MGRALGQLVLDGLLGRPVGALAEGLRDGGVRLPGVGPLGLLLGLGLGGRLGLLPLPLGGLLLGLVVVALLLGLGLLLLAAQEAEDVLDHVRRGLLVLGQRLPGRLQEELAHLGALGLLVGVVVLLVGREGGVQVLALLDGGLQVRDQRVVLVLLRHGPLSSVISLDFHLGHATGPDSADGTVRIPSLVEDSEAVPLLQNLGLQVVRIHVTLLGAACTGRTHDVELTVDPSGVNQRLVKVLFCWGVTTGLPLLLDQLPPPFLAPVVLLLGGGHHCGSHPVRYQGPYP